MSAWQPIESAPRDGIRVLLLCGETIPNNPFVAVACFVNGDESEELGYRSYAKYGSWMIWHQRGDDFYCIDVNEPTHWMPLPAPPEAP